MDLKELLPLLLVAAFWIISAARKKKRPVSESEEEVNTAPSDSPWDDLMRELQRGAESDAGTVSRSRPVQPAIPVPDVTSVDMRTYDDDAIEELENRPVFSYDDPVEDSPSERILVVDGEVSPTPQPVADPETASSGGMFPNGFDPKMAILYSEILKPRF